VIEENYSENDVVERSRPLKVSLSGAEFVEILPGCRGPRAHFPSSHSITARTRARSSLGSPFKREDNSGRRRAPARLSRLDERVETPIRLQARDDGGRVGGTRSRGDDRSIQEVYLTRRPSRSRRGAKRQPTSRTHRREKHGPSRTQPSRNTAVEAPTAEPVETAVEEDAVGRGRRDGCRRCAGRGRSTTQRAGLADASARSQRGRKAYAQRDSGPGTAACRDHRRGDRSGQERGEGRSRVTARRRFRAKRDRAPTCSAVPRARRIVRGWGPGCRLHPP